MRSVAMDIYRTDRSIVLVAIPAKGPPSLALDRSRAMSLNLEDDNPDKGMPSSLVESKPEKIKPGRCTGWLKRNDDMIGPTTRPVIMLFEM